MALQARHLSLKVFEDMEALASYTGFLVQKKVGQSHLKNVVSTYIKVLAFLDATERCGDAAHVDAKMAWLCNLKSQVSKLVARPSKDSVQLKEEGEHAHSSCKSAMRSPLKSACMHQLVLPGACAGQWMDAKELLEFHQKVEEESLMAYDVLKAEETPTIRDLKLAARRVQDALILGLSFAYLPPPRVTCLITTVLPDYDGPCRCVGKVAQLSTS